MTRGTGRRRCRADALLIFLSAVGILLAPTAVRAESASAPDSAAASARNSARASAPDSARTALLRFAVRNLKDVRVVTNSTELLGDHGVVSPDGLRLRIRPGSSISSSSKVRLVPWAEIESIHVRRASRGTGIAVCGTLGLIAGLSIAFAEVDAGALIFGSQGLNGTPIVLGLAGGATLGWLIDHPGPWNTVYP